ncbi:unnamed protein product [Pneumocystis jirovecii]|uniref:Cyclin C-terminal domain-containing protein n=1 Tax=Pneumocystis jirovecii TaxID=42068 RepID=L0PAE4_PNEJI|nr:unnamed protein product [Pneumocystis jirovecii]
MPSQAVKRRFSVDRYAKTSIAKHKAYTPLSPVSGAQIEGVEKQWGDNQEEERGLGVVEGEYMEEIEEYMKKMEVSVISHWFWKWMEDWMKETQAHPEMMDLQPELEWYMRPYLIDFIIEVHAGFRLQATTLYLTLLGCSALWIAAKFEEPKDRVPTLKELCTMCCDSYREEMFVQMESHIIKTLDWMIGHPTTIAFLQMKVMQSSFSEKVVLLARFFTELALFHRDLICLSSVIAEASLFLAQSILQPKKHYLIPSSEVLSCIHKLQRHLNDVSNVLFKKYSHIGVKKIISNYLASISLRQGFLQNDSPHTPPHHKHRQHSQFHLCINTNNHAPDSVADQLKNIQENENGLPTPPADDNQRTHYVDASPMVT